MIYAKVSSRCFIIYSSLPVTAQGTGGERKWGRKNVHTIGRYNVRGARSLWIIICARPPPLVRPSVRPSLLARSRLSRDNGKRYTYSGDLRFNPEPPAEELQRVAQHAGRAEVSIALLQEDITTRCVVQRAPFISGH